MPIGSPLRARWRPARHAMQAPPVSGPLSCVLAGRPAPQGASHARRDPRLPLPLRQYRRAACTIPRRAPAPPSTPPRRRRSSLRSSEAGWTLSEIIVTHRHADHVQGIEALKRRYGCRVVAPEKARGDGPGRRRLCGRRATRCGSASFRPMSGKRPATAGTTSPTGSRPTGRCLPATRCSRSAAAASWNRPSPRCGARSRGSRRCPARRGSIAATTTSCRTASSRSRSSPTTRRSRPAWPKPRRRRRRDASSSPRRLAQEKATNPFLRAGEPVGRPRRQDGGRRSRQGVPGAARMEEPVLTAHGPGRT